MNLFVEALRWITAPANWTGAGGITARLLQHLAVTLAVVGVAALLAIPVGVVIGHARKGQALVPLIAGAARALPTLGLLTLFGLALGIGLVAPFLALLILAIPPLLAGAHAGVAATSPVTVDAARAIGLSEPQILFGVELPVAAPIVLEGLRSTMLQVIATATLAAYTADSGLGRFLFTGIKTRDYPQMLGGALLVVVLALVLDLLLWWLQRAVTRALDPSRKPAIAKEFA